MNKIVLDFETYCDLDITKVGAFKYASHPSCRIVCMSWKVDDDPTYVCSHNDLRGIWVSPIVAKFYAFNATFEFLIWNIVGVRDYGWEPLKLSQMVDLQALCARYRMPQKLGKAAIALGCDTSKLASGARLIKLCCTPGHNPTEQNFQDLYEYCRIDTEVAYEIMNRLPADHFTPEEQALWELTYRMNEVGVPVDVVEVEAILEYTDKYTAEMAVQLPIVTDGFVKTAGQIQKIRDFCEQKGVMLPNLQAGTVEQVLYKGGLPENVEKVLKIRQAIGRTSVKKYDTLKAMLNNGYVQGNLAHHGAGTGRWAGRGFQYHNLPRAKVDDPDMWIQKFIDKDEIDDPIQIAKALIRPMIKAPEGQILMVSDFTGIENRVLAWLAGDDVTLQNFRDGVCQYTDMAASLYRVPYDLVSPDQRLMGKAIILGCGFMMGAKRFRAEAAKWGITITLMQAKSIVKKYRAKYHLIEKMWYALNDAAKHAIRYRGKITQAHSIKFQVVRDKVKRDWLRITLPSGRTLMYADAHIGEGKYGPVICYTGMNTKTHQMDTLEISPGLLTENIVQAIARDLLAYGKENIEIHMIEATLVLSVHDEAGVLMNKYDVRDDTMEYFNELLCDSPPWAEGIPLEAEGYIAKRYRKG